jgi:hypothetical protein
MRDAARVLASLWVLLACAGCGESDTHRGDDGGGTDGDVTSPGTCGFGSLGPVVRPTVGGGPTTFDTLEGAAMNQTDLDRQAPLPSPRLGAMRRGPCGVVGLAFRRTGEGGDPELAYVELVDETGAGPGTPEAVDSAEAGDPGLDLSLFYEADCTPVVLQGDGADWVQHTRGAAGWTAAPAGLDLEALTGSAGSVTVVGADVDREGRFHLLGHAGAGPTLVQGTREPTAGSAWSFAAHPLPPGTQIDHYRVDSTGVLHAVFRNQVFPCDPSCDVSLYYGRLEPGGTWTSEVVQQGVWGPPLDQFSADPWLALDADDRPVVAAHFQVRVETGSLQSAELRVYLREGADDFCRETVISRSDGYEGGDGPNFTGALPIAEIDGTGRIHVVFVDQAIWHDASGWANEMRGNLRHAVRGSTGWAVTTLVEQQGQTESPNPLIGYGAPLLALAQDDAGLLVTAVERTWATGSIYNTTEVPATYRTQIVFASLAP